jgi:hypothetical protein
MMRYKGWYGESYRHSLAARGYRLGFVADPTFIAINEAANLRRMQNVMPSSYIPPAELPAETPEQAEARVREADIYFEQRAADMEKLRKVDELLKDARPERIQNMIKNGILTQQDIDFYKKNMYLLYSSGPEIEMLPGHYEVPISDQDAAALGMMYSKYPPEALMEEFRGQKTIPSLSSLRSKYLKFEGPGASYPVYGEGRSPFIPYWYGSPQEMTAEQALARFNYLKAAKEVQIYKRLASNHLELNSNLLNPVIKQRLIADLKVEAKRLAEPELLDDLGVYNMPWPDRFKGMEPSSRELAEAYPEIKQLAFKSFQKGPKEGIDTGGSYLKFKRPSTSSNYYEFVDPFTGKTRMLYYKTGVIDRKTLDYTPDPSEKRVDTAIANKERQWAGFLGSLQSRTKQSGYKRESIPFTVKNVNQAAKWLKENKYPNADIDVLKEEVIDLGQKYLNVKKQQRERELESKARVIKYEPSESYRERISQVYAGGAIFNSQQAAQVLVNDARRAGIKFNINKIKQDGIDKWSVVSE